MEIIMNESPRYVGQLVSFVRNDNTNEFDIKIAICPERFFGDFFEKSDKSNLNQSQVYSMRFAETNSGFEIQPDQKLDECLRFDELHSESDIADAESYRKIQSVRLVEGILEILKETNLFGIYVSGLVTCPPETDPPAE